ncbi:MAG TPA: secretin N-terminal domain-containing protein [Kiritimatiellia bacterium]|nr:secretin N-terminal domain-containing protein [Kiritimatiellia bacterium]
MKRTVHIVLAILLGVAPLPGARALAPGEGYVNFNFDQVDIPVLVKLVGEMTGRRFVVGDEISGRVTVVTPQRIPVRDAYPLLVSILESRGLSVIERDGIHQIVVLPERTVAAATMLDPEADTADAVGLVTRLIRVQHVNVAELRRLLEPLVRGGKAGALAAFPPTNHLIVTDTAESVRNIERIIGELDRPGAARVVEVILLQHAAPDDLARQLVAAMRGGTTAGDKVARHLQQVGEGMASLPSEVVVVSSPRANSLILVGTPVQLNEMREIVARMDVAAPSGYGRLHAIFLRYLSAEDAAKSLNALLAKGDKEQRAPISIEHNLANNALIVDATPQDFEFLRKLVEQLDQVPQQVMVEVLLAEVAVGRNLDLGVRLATIDQPRDGSTTVLGVSRPSEVDSVGDFIQSGLFPQGLAVGVARGTYTDPNTGTILPNVPLLVQALARNRDVKILSNVPLWAQNNAEASVSVVENIPILRSTIEGGAGTSRDVIQNIDRMDVGIKLKMTPHVNPDGQITLKLNPSIEAIVDQGPVNTQFAPTIAKREVSTTVTMPNKATVVISGLIREDRVNAVNKVPLLGDLPLIGFLFRSKSERMQRTNLLIFVTPHIVTDMAMAREMQERLQQQTQLTPEVIDLQAPVPRR